MSADGDSRDLTQIRRELEAKGHIFEGIPGRCLKCSKVLAVLCGMDPKAWECTDIRNEVFTLVLEYFHGARDRAELWMTSKNPLLGDVTPDDMIAMGRGQKVLRWVRESLSENEVAE